MHGLTFQTDLHHFFTFKNVGAAAAAQARCFLNHPRIDITGPEDYYQYCKESKIKPPVPNKRPNTSPKKVPANKGKRKNKDNEDDEAVEASEQESDDENEESETDDQEESTFIAPSKARKTLCNCMTLGGSKYSCTKGQSSAKHCLCPCAEAAEVNSKDHCSPNCYCSCNLK